MNFFIFKNIPPSPGIQYLLVAALMQTFLSQISSISKTLDILVSGLFDVTIQLAHDQ